MNMKKCIIIVLIFLTVSVTAQQDTARSDIVRLPDSSAIGAPIGNIVSKNIGPEGGTIVSEDGRVELVFPAGTLASPKEISIQPLTNVLTGAMGNAYRFEPSGIQFAKPVSYILHYTDEEAQICPPDLMAFGIQENSGKWTYDQFKNWDSVNKTLTAYIKHFTIFAPYPSMHLIPEYYEVNLEDRLLLHVVRMFPWNTPGSEPIDAYINPRVTSADWYVNGEKDGNLEYGATESLHPQYIAAWYTAPRMLPAHDKVKIECIVVGTETGKAEIKRRMTCIIILYDSYKVLITDTMETRVGEGTFIVDTGTCVVRVNNTQIIVDSVRNYTPTSFVKHKPPLGARLEVNLMDCEGPVNIGKKKYNGQSVLYTHSFFIEENKPVKVLVTFEIEGVTAFKYKYSVGGITIRDSQPTESVPELVNFYVNGEAQRYSLPAAHGGVYSIDVKRVQPMQHEPTKLTKTPPK